MGGSGSGTWIRLNVKKRTERLTDINIYFMRKQNLLQPGITGIMSWYCRGKKSDSIGFQVNKKCLILTYRIKQNKGQWENIENKIFFTWTSCNYGGKRYWFICPQCNRRAAIIYAGKYYRCRSCHNLTYASQQESKSFRLLRKAQKIRRRLETSCDITMSILFKPKNMHQKTFDRLCTVAEDAGNHALGMMGQRWKINL